MSCLSFSALLGALALASAEAGSVLSTSAACASLHTPVVMRAECLARLRGGDADAADDLDDDDDEDVASSVSDDPLENPFLDASAAAAAGGAGDMGNLADLASTLKDPAALQEALKELQDPAVQQQVKQMLEDPAFQESMKAYMEQITKDPQVRLRAPQTSAVRVCAPVHERSAARAAH